MDGPSDDDVVTWWGLVIEGYHATQEQLMGELERRFGLVPATFDVLVRLVRTPGSRLPMTKLAREAALSSGGFTKVADRMVATGLIRREASDTDRRVTYAALTEDGHRTAERALAACAEILREVFLAPLGSDRAERAADDLRALRDANVPEPSDNGARDDEEHANLDRRNLDHSKRDHDDRAGR